MKRKLLTSAGLSIFRYQTTVATSSWQATTQFASIPCGIFRTYSSISNGDLQQAFQSIQGTEFQKHLEELRNKTSVLPYSALVAEFQDRIPASTPEDATRTCQALIEAGSVLRFGELVYLKPREVADALQQVVPFYSSLAEEELQQAQAELTDLESKRLEIEKKARMRSTLMNWGFFGLLAAQWGLLFRLTYWELSWDVIEPITCFLGGFTSVASYAFFLLTRRDFTFETMHHRFMTKYERRAFEDAQFDPVKYQRLKGDVRRYTDILKAQRKLEEVSKPNL